MRKIITLSLLSCMALGVSACRTLWDPTPMGSGYLYDTHAYKAPPGDEPSNLGYPYSYEKNQEILQVWRMVAADIVSQLEDENDLSAQSIYIHKRDDYNAFNAAFDHVLREQFRERGYTLTNTPGEAVYQILHEAHIPVDVSEGTRNDRSIGKLFQEQVPNREYLLILNLINDGAYYGKSAGVYQLPTYGYEEDDGHDFDLMKPVVGEVKR